MLSEIGVALLAQWPITLVLMMINSCSYSTIYLVFILSQICDQDLSRCLASIKDLSQVLKLARFDSRAYASRPHQVLKRSLALWWIVFGPSQEDEKTSSEALQEKT